MYSKSAFEIVKTSQGATSIRNIHFNEIMHNPVGPWAEARSLYVEQSALVKKLQLPTPEPLVLYDVGLGAGFNALAAVDAYFQLPAENRRPLHIYSFERDLTLFDFALDHIADFPENLPFRPLMEAILKDGKYSDASGLHWEVYPGDFAKPQTFDYPPAEIVFFDPYSPKVNTDMWELSVFEKMKSHMQTPSVLLTYSNATPVRTTLLLAGFFVGEGDATGKKLNTTIASTELSQIPTPLADRWIERWERSHVNFGLGTTLNVDEIRKRFKTHPQFIQMLPNYVSRD